MANTLKVDLPKAEPITDTDLAELRRVNDANMHFAQWPNDYLRHLHMTMPSVLARLDAAEERADYLANTHIDVMEGVLCNYTTVHSELGEPVPVAKVMAEIEEQLEADFKTHGCPDLAARRARFRDLLLKIQCDRSSKLDIHRTQLVATLKNLLAHLKLIGLRGTAVDQANGVLKSVESAIAKEGS